MKIEILYEVDRFHQISPLCFAMVEMTLPHTLHLVGMGYVIHGSEIAQDL